MAPIGVDALISPGAGSRCKRTNGDSFLPFGLDKPETGFDFRPMLGLVGEEKENVCGPKSSNHGCGHFLMQSGSGLGCEGIIRYAEELKDQKRCALVPGALDLAPVQVLRRTLPARRTGRRFKSDVRVEEKQVAAGETFKGTIQPIITCILLIRDLLSKELRLRDE